jgi:hypothetical protein
MGAKIYHLQLILSLNNLGQQVSISKPEGAISLRQQIADSMQKSKDAQVMADLNSLRVGAELYYNDRSSYAGFCSSSNNTKYGVFSPAQQLVSLATATKSAPVCRTSGSTYLVAAKLSGGAYSCVDSTGTSTIVNAAPSGLACK